MSYDHIIVGGGSIVPTVVRANTNISTIMMADKIATHIKAEKHG